MRKRKLSKSIYLINFFDPEMRQAMGLPAVTVPVPFPEPGPCPSRGGRSESSTLLGLLVLYLPYAVVVIIRHIEIAG